MISLHDYQKVGRAFLLGRRYAYLADVMGLGKSCQALFASKEIPGKKLIVCPAILRLNWANELKLCECDPQEYTITSYNQLHKVLGIDYSVAIFDEAHYLKNMKAKRTLLANSVRAYRKWWLSGTPLKKSAEDLYPFLYFGGIWTRGYWQYLTSFAQSFQFQVRGRTVRKFSGVRNPQMLKKLLRPHMLRRFLDNVDLPGIQYTEVPIGRERSSKYSDHFEALDRVLSDEYDGDAEHLATLRKDLGLEKLAASVEYLVMLKESVTKSVVVFAHHRAVLTGLADCLNKEGYSVQVLIGGQSEKEREAIFGSLQKIDYLLVSMEAASIGLNLIHTNTAVFIELPWGSDTLDQSVGRLHRLGQKEMVNILFLILENSFDDRVKGIIAQKRRMIREVIGGS